MRGNKIYSPPRTFGIDYDRLVKFAREKSFVFSSVDLARCEQDVVDLHAERAAHDAAEATYRELHTKFALAQRDRYIRFSQLLEAARGAFRSDPAMLAVLKSFTRKFTPRSETPETEQA
jgi:hypothetical protein